MEDGQKQLEGKKIWAYSTSTSRVVPHHSTILAARSLTSRFGWDVVHSTSYGRKRMLRCMHGIYLDKNLSACVSSECVCAVCACVLCVHADPREQECMHVTVCASVSKGMFC
jgi:hypothetical protein